MGSQTQDETRSLLLSRLSAGEELKWCGTRGRLFGPKGRPSMVVIPFLFSALLLVLGGLPLIQRTWPGLLPGSVAVSNLPGPDPDVTVLAVMTLMALLFTVPIIVVALRCRSIVYAVTDRRVFSLYRSGRELKTFVPDRRYAVQVYQTPAEAQAGTGTVYLQPLYAIPATNDGISTDQILGDLDEGFALIGIQDPKRVAALIQDLLPPSDRDLQGAAATSPPGSAEAPRGIPGYEAAYNRDPLVITQSNDTMGAGIITYLLAGVACLMFAVTVGGAIDLLFDLGEWSVGIGGAVFVSCCVALVKNLRTRLGEGFTVWPDHLDRDGGDGAWTLPYEDLESITYWEGKIVLRTLPDVERVVSVQTGQLMRALEGTAAPFLALRTRDLVEKGQRVEWGHLEITLDGLRSGTDASVYVPWKSLDRFLSDETGIELAAGSKRMKIPWAVPNAVVLPFLVLLWAPPVPGGPRCISGEGCWEAPWRF